MALKTRTGSEAYAPLAQAIIGGLIGFAALDGVRGARGVPPGLRTEGEGAPDMRAAAFVLSGSLFLLSAAPPERLTLAEAEAIALKRHPVIAASNLEAAASRERIDEARSTRFPFVTANLTGVGADNETRIAAGGLNNPVIYSRVATGVTINQTVLDFGRTSKLIESSKASAAASDERVDATRAEVNAFGAESLLQCAPRGERGSGREGNRCGAADDCGPGE